tara:strand:- start:1566 stop:1709 length:144 start_codon:yes stop_codon:yes gene_type:complete
MNPPSAEQETYLKRMTSAIHRRMDNDQKIKKRPLDAEPSGDTNDKGP